MPRIKITFKEYSTSFACLLPEMPEDQASLIAGILARAQRVNLRHVGEDYQQPVFVGEPTEGIEVRVLDGDAVMSRKQYAQASADHRAAQAAEAQKKADAAKRDAEAMPEDALQTA